MRKHFLLGTGVAGLILLATAAWTQDPEPVRVQAKGELPTYRDVVKGYVGKSCGAFSADNTYRLHFPEVKEMNGMSVTLTAVGADFVQLLWPDGEHRYVPLERIELWVKP